MNTNTALFEQSSARQALLQAALHAFAQHGINGVSLRSIVARAGQNNQSAIHYHFKNKQGLVVAVLDYVRDLLSVDMAQAGAEFFAQSPADWKPNVLVSLMCRPFIRLSNSSHEGRAAIKFMSRLTWQEGGQGQLLLVAAVQPYFAQFSSALIALNPSKPIDMLTFQLYLAVNTLIHGLADASLLTQLPAMGVERIGREQPDMMLEYFMRYVAGGLFSAAHQER